MNDTSTWFNSGRAFLEACEEKDGTPANPVEKASTDTVEIQDQQPVEKSATEKRWFKDRWFEAFSLEMFHNPPQGAKAAQISRSMTLLGSTLFLAVNGQSKMATISIVKLADRTGMSTNTVQSNLARLEDAGWITRQKRKNHQTGSTYSTYHLKIKEKK